MVTRLEEGVMWLDLQGVNAYLVEDDDALTLIDAGMPWQRDRLLRGLEAVAGSPAAVDRVLVTHVDFDHVGGIDLGGLDAPVAVGVDDESALVGSERPDLTNPKGVLQQVSGLVRTAGDLAVRTVTDGDTVGGFTAYHTPGHTPGHTCFVHEGLSVAFLGDLVRERDGAFERPPWFLNADHDRAGESVVAFADRAPAFEMGCPGHGTPVVTNGRDVLAGCAGNLRN
ncbi:MAG: MBL fold metallo-hydrolase [Haloarculaceae archaeon]